MKVGVISPDEKLFFQIFVTVAKLLILPSTRMPSYTFSRNGIASRAVRCKPSTRDILKIVVSLCEYEGSQPRMTPELIDEASRSYFVDRSKAI